jgi:hypothetical protein
MIKHALINGVYYNAIEVTLIAIIGVVHLMGGEVYSWFLWLAFLAAALWTLLACTGDAEEEAEQLVLFREVFITDFLMGAFFLLVLSTMTMQYGLQYGSIFFIAAIQNLRYSAMAYDWIKEEHDDGPS